MHLALGSHRNDLDMGMTWTGTYWNDLRNDVDRLNLQHRATTYRSSPVRCRSRTVIPMPRAREHLLCLSDTPCRQHSRNGNLRLNQTV